MYLMLQHCLLAVKPSNYKHVSCKICLPEINHKFIFSSDKPEKLYLQRLEWPILLKFRENGQKSSELLWKWKQTWSWLHYVQGPLQKNICHVSTRRCCAFTVWATQSLIFLLDKKIYMSQDQMLLSVRHVSTWRCCAYSVGHSNPRRYNIFSG